MPPLPTTAVSPPAGAWPSMRVALLGLALLGASSAVRGQTTSLPPDEAVAFYPTEAVLDTKREVWVTPLHALVFEPAREASARRALLAALANVLGLPGDSPRNETFMSRADDFLVDNEQDQRVVVTLAGMLTKLEPSGRSGHAYGTLEIPAAVADQAREESQPDWLTVGLVLPPNDARRMTGRVRLLPPTGLSIVTDLDALLEITEVSDSRLRLARTYLEPFETLPGLAGLYADIAAEGATFHYVSGSPWQLHAPLTECLGAAGFPEGPLTLREFRWRDEKVSDWLPAADGHRLVAMLTLAERLSGRTLILVGDSGATDPEIYGRIARTWPDRVEHILIRDVTGEPADGVRYRAAFHNLPPERWTLFKSADELSTLHAPPAPTPTGMPPLRIR